MSFSIEDIEQLSWQKMHNLIPAIVQCERTMQVLMCGYMNKAALEQTIRTGWVTFFSRSAQKLWIKGETSGNKLRLIRITADCDKDSLLITAQPIGPTCHLGSESCFEGSTIDPVRFLQQLENIIVARALERPTDSYTASLFNAGMNTIAQKVGEEAIETIIAAIAHDKNATCNEAADLMFHLLTLLIASDVSLADVIDVLRKRNIVL